MDDFVSGPTPRPFDSAVLTRLLPVVMLLATVGATYGSLARGKAQAAEEEESCSVSERQHEPRACQPHSRGTERNSATGTWPTAGFPPDATTLGNPGEADE